MSNTNCLEGCACPKCGQEDCFDVEATSTFRLIDNGTEYHTDVEYDDDSEASCPDCAWSGKWKYVHLTVTEPNFMDLDLWNSLGKDGQEAWKEKREITPYPKQLDPYVGDRVEVETVHGEKYRFWVGVSAGWGPCYLEIKRRDSTGGIACDTRYNSVKLIKKGPRN